MQSRRACRARGGDGGRARGRGALRGRAAEGEREIELIYILYYRIVSVKYMCRSY